MTVATKPQFRELMPDGMIRVHLHPGQQRVMASKARFTFMLGSPQVGKTCLSPHWLANEINNKERGGAGDYLAVTSTYDLFKLKLLPEFLSVFEGGVIGNQPYKADIGRYWAGERIIELAEDLTPGKFWAKKQDDPMWGRIILRSADAKAGLEAATIKAAVLDEPGQKEFTRDAWDGVLRRLSLSMGRVLGTTTIYCTNWVKHDIFDPWKAGDRDIQVIQVDSLENPVFPRAEYERAERMLPKWKFRMIYQGRYETPAGLIYDKFDALASKVHRIPINPKWNVYVGHDFGPVNMAACFYAHDPDTGLYWLFATYRAGGPVYNHVEEFKRITAGLNVVKRIGGSAGKTNEEGWREAFSAHGWPIISPKDYLKKPQVRIQRVNELHALNKVMVMDDLYEYLDEKLSFCYKLDDNYNPLQDEIENESAFHLMSAEQYILSDFTPETAGSSGPQVSMSSWA